MHLERRVLRRRDDVVDAYLVGSPPERVTAVGSARALHDPRATQLEHDLLDIVARQTLLRGDLAARHRSVVNATGQVQGTDESVFGLSGDPHVCKLIRARESG